MTSDLITTVAMIARDPLISGSVLIAFGASVSRMLFKQKPIWRAVARVIFLALLTLLLLYRGIVPYQPLQLTGAPYRDTIAGTLKIAWWFWAAWFLVALVRAAGQSWGERMAAVWTMRLLWGDGTFSRQTRYRRYYRNCSLHRV
jgi:hypothetical protein